jgi:hypothetical protein
MLSSIIASKSARLITACVCPVVGAGTLTMSVPKVRNAVHKVTAPREYALPKTRERAVMPVSAVAPCTTLGATPLSAGYIEDVGTPFGPTVSYDPVSGPPIGNPHRPASPPQSTKIAVSAVPEPQTWLQLILGFTLVGGAVRMARKRPTEEEEALLERVELLKKQG